MAAYGATMHSPWPKAHALLYILILAGTLLVIAGLLIKPAMALLTSQQAVDGNTFTTRNLIAPSSLTASPVGHDVSLSWPAGQNGSGYAVLGVANGTSSNCSSATFGNLASTAGTSYTDAGRYAPQGTYFCYQVQTTYGPWNSIQSNPISAAQIGFVASTVQLTNAGNTTGCSPGTYGQAGVMDCGDQITLNFNQAVDTTTGPQAGNTVCTTGSTILLASTTTTGGCESAAFKVGSFTKSTGTAPASQTVAHALGVTPKALILWTNGVTNTSFNGGFLYSYGVTDGTTSQSIGAASRDNVGSSSSSTRLANKALTIVQWGQVLVAEADLSSMDATNFTLNWTTNNSQAYVIHFMAIGGTDVSAKVVGWTMATGTGNSSVTGVGFKPDVVLHSYGDDTVTAAPPTSVADAGFGLGIMDANGNQGVSFVYTKNGAGTSDTQRGQQTNAAIFAFNNSLAVTKKASFVSMDADGFTLNYSTTNGNKSRAFSLALKGLRAKVGSFNKSTATAPASQSITGVGFQPRVVLLSSFQDVAQASPVVETRYGIGASDGTTHGASAFIDANGLATTLVKSIDKTSKVFIKVNNNTPAIDAEADLSSLDSDGFTLNWTTNDAVVTQILYLALAPLSTTYEPTAFATGSFAKSTGTAPASQTVAHGLGVTPKALILWTSGVTNTSFTSAYRLAYGMTDGTTSESLAASSQDAMASSNSITRLANKALTIIQWSSTVEAEADLSSWDSTNFILNWTTNNTSAYVIHFIAIGGTGISAKLVSWTQGTVAGNYSVTGVGFQPDLVLHAYPRENFTTAPPANHNDTSFGVGMMDGSGDQAAAFIDSKDANSPSLTARGQLTNAALFFADHILNVKIQASYVSMDTDGFTINYSTPAKNASYAFSLALKGIRAKIGSFNKTSNTAPASQSVTGLGFQPSTVMLFSFQDVVQGSAVANARFGIGASDGTTSGSSAVTDGSGLNPTVVRSIDKTKVFMKVNNNTPAIDAEADLSSLDTDGFTLNWTTNDAVATQMVYLALAAGTTVEPLNLGLLSGGITGQCSCRFSATYTWSNGNKTLVVTIGARTVGTSNPTMSSATWTFNPTPITAKLLSASGVFHICDNNGRSGYCLPNTGGASTLRPSRGAGASGQTHASAPTAQPHASEPIMHDAPTAAPSPMPSAVPTHEPPPSPTATPTNEPRPSPTATPTRTPVSTATAVPPTPTSLPATKTPLPTVSPSPTVTCLRPTPTRNPEYPTPTPTPTITVWPTPSPTPCPPIGEHGAATSTPALTATGSPTQTKSLGTPTPMATPLH